LPYLLKVGWEGETADVEDQIENLSRNAERIDLDFDVDIAVMSKLGFECYPALDRARLADFIGHFVSAGLCVEEKAQQLGRWCGLAHQSAPPSSGWPSGLQTASSLLGGRFHSTFIRWLHHVKAVYQAGFTPQAKAYLAVKHLWLSPVLLKDVLNGVRPEALGSTPGKLGACA
jgi:hypothetical protein